MVIKNKIAVALSLLFTLNSICTPLQENPMKNSSPTTRISRLKERAVKFGRRFAGTREYSSEEIQLARAQAFAVISCTLLVMLGVHYLRSCPRVPLAQNDKSTPQGNGKDDGSTSHRNDKNKENKCKKGKEKKEQENGKGDAGTPHLAKEENNAQRKEAPASQSPWTDAAGAWIGRIHHNLIKARKEDFRNQSGENSKFGPYSHW